MFETALYKIFKLVTICTTSHNEMVHGVDSYHHSDTATPESVVRRDVNNPFAPRVLFFMTSSKLARQSCCPSWHQNAFAEDVALRDVIKARAFQRCSLWRHQNTRVTGVVARRWCRQNAYVKDVVQHRDTHEYNGSLNSFSGTHCQNGEWGIERGMDIWIEGWLELGFCTS